MGMASLRSGGSISHSESEWRPSYFSGSEVERRSGARRVPLEVPPRGTKPKKAAGKPSKGTARGRYSCAIGLRELMGVLAVIGPLGTCTCGGRRRRRWSARA